MRRRLSGSIGARWRAPLISASERYDAHAQLQREVREELLARLPFFKLTPQRILDLGLRDWRGRRRVAPAIPSAPTRSRSIWRQACSLRRGGAAGSGAASRASVPMRRPCRSPAAALIWCSVR
jgi:hypothetical protein